LIVDKVSIQELKNGSQFGFKQLVESHKNKVINTCFGFVHNRADAEDIAQDVFVEVYQSVNSFNEDSSISTWIYRIAVNKSLDFIRKSKRKKRWAELTRINLDSKNETDHWFTDDNNPQLTLENLERMKILNAAIETLPQNQRAAFTLHKYEDLSYKEVAEILNTSVSSVESLMHRAKINLQQKLEKYYLSEKN
jgi:RNA polymerase sigma-70 factor (ECF subfamily)